MLMSMALRLAPIVPAYAQLRFAQPLIPARLVLSYLRDNEGLSFDQFVCAHTHGHSWTFAGTAYGGEDDSYHGEGRSYCALCGADGDG